MDGGGRGGRIGKAELSGGQRRQKLMVGQKGDIGGGTERMSGGRSSQLEGGGTRCLARQKREAGIVRQGRGRERWTVRMKRQGWTASLRMGGGRNSEV